MQNMIENLCASYEAKTKMLGKKWMERLTDELCVCVWGGGGGG